MVPDQGIKVEVPSFVEISCRTTIPCMEEMTQGEWEWISQGAIFQTLWGESFDFEHRSGKGEECIGKLPPATIEELIDSDPGIVHVAGLIVQSCEAMFNGKNVFLRDPETLLHPSTERYIAGMLHKLHEICGGRGVVTKVDTPPANLTPAQKRKATIAAKKAKAEEEQAFKGPVYEDPKNIAFTLEWLSKLPPEKEIAQIGGQRCTAAILINEVTNKTSIGKQLVDILVSKRDDTPRSADLPQA